MRQLRILARFGVLLAVTVTTGCVESKRELLPVESRVLLFLPETRLEMYGRSEDGKGWGEKAEIGRFMIDPALVLRPLDEKGASSSDRYTIHPLSDDRYLVQVWQSDSRSYIYAVLQVRDGAYFVGLVDCKKIDQNAFRAGGGTISGDTCSLDSASDPVALLRQAALQIDNPTLKMVPLR